MILNKAYEFDKKMDRFVTIAYFIILAIVSGIYAWSLSLYHFLAYIILVLLLGVISYKKTRAYLPNTPFFQTLLQNTPHPTVERFYKKHFYVKKYMILYFIILISVLAFVQLTDKTLNFHWFTCEEKYGCENPYCDSLDMNIYQQYCVGHPIVEYNQTIGKYPSAKTQAILKMPYGLYVFILLSNCFIEFIYYKWRYGAIR